MAGSKQAKSQTPPLDHSAPEACVLMTSVGNFCVVLIGFGAYFMFLTVTESAGKYDYLLAILMSLPLLALFFGTFAAITSAGKLDFLGWPRLLQYFSVAITSLSLTVLMGFTIGLHGSARNEFPWAVSLFFPWAAYMVPLLVALIGLLWLNSHRLAFPESLLRAAFGVMAAIAIGSNIVFGIEACLALGTR